jgi:hypothetical protein
LMSSTKASARSEKGASSAPARRPFVCLTWLAAASLQSIDAVFSGPNFLPAHVTQIALWRPLNALLPAVATSTADGGQSVQSFLLGLPLWDFLYTPQGQLTEMVFGPGLLSWDFNFSYSGVLTVIRVDGVLPVAVIVNTPGGPLLVPLAS